MLTDAEKSEYVGAIARDGYVIIPDAVPLALCDALGDDLRRLEVELQVGPGQNIFEGFRTVRIYNLLARGELYQRVPVQEKVLPIVEEVLDRGCLVSSLSSIAIGPDETAQPLHADDQLIPIPRPHVPLVCNTMWALTDFTEENGATRLVPGSHLYDRAPEPYADVKTVPAVMKRGSVLVYNGSLWHCGGANRSREVRLGLAMNYCAGFVRQQENQQLGIPLSVARTFSARLRKLIGFGLYKGVMGHIDRCSPVDLLDESGPRPVVGVPRA